jgi:hypothetical protein
MFAPAELTAVMGASHRPCLSDLIAPPEGHGCYSAAGLEECCVSISGAGRSAGYVVAQSAVDRLFEGFGEASSYDRDRQRLRKDRLNARNGVHGG